MLLGFVILFAYIIVVWLTFFKFKWMKFNITWGIVSVSVGLHLLIIFLIGLRFITPYSTNARIIQHTIQLTPRLTEPTLVTDVLVEPNVPVKKGQPLFQFDRRPYEYKVRELEAELAKAKQNVHVLEADIEVARQKVIQLQSELVYARYEQKLSQNLASRGAGPEEDVQKWAARVAANEAAIREAQAELKRAELNYQSQIDGVNTTVAAIQAKLDLARYYLDNTLMVAPEDGYIINLQVRPGMVAGALRIGAIATFICDSDRYLLANYFLENLKHVKEGQEAEVALDLYPGQIFTGRVEAIWRGSGHGQMLPSGKLPDFFFRPTELPQGQFVVAIRLDEEDQSKFPIGTQGRAAIYTDTSSGFVVLRKIGIRAYSWANWLYPFAG
ncbi:HlyD family secretion protein [Microbulbifer thermotolerans]|uniref:Efflux RND transporter periplasmic adaptor subunit n=1 Tax=Microbulbifer thermotolerans TaxID=252514 RepID=A0A143HL66_MICTH|nr:efflux RND transporter periplasmic adaptor subunit [Microbulbifer thermotolerans]AMX02465.1 secretion protein HlyD [Microbulbifer thermotolerans]MCX2779316.1 efflux RND transporter periplasmic adaptor subunit [Microbulbifer thermotolerans]MCX2784473.1 efflux RND transporter periplasmic adaptor subunit [Microbulbifer thermotolerans]MCX2795065.1 efflux RND transporter periplasmic adaptor subunit [Microbulbifer thermotolerans]MCX2803173.1 efflux RND transporter periplasmic adaptor subunit [Mic